MDESPGTTPETGTPVREPPDAHAAGAWQQALTHLQNQMPASVFDGLLRGSRLVGASDGTWTIGVRPHTVEWLSNRPYPAIQRIVSSVAGSEITLAYVVDERPPALAMPSGESAPREAGTRASKPTPRDADTPPMQSAEARNPPRSEPQSTPPSALECLLSFDPNSASGGGFWKMGHYANWFWAAFLGTVAWRVYELVVSGDKRPQKTVWTPPRRFSISELARAIASGRERGPNRTQIRGRYRCIAGQRVWQPGAFDLLTQEGVARIEWHAGDVHWRPWRPGGSCRPGRSGIRIVYRISVVTSLPLLSPRQVARLPAENQVAHERYLAERAQDTVAWEQITLPTLAGLDPGQAPGGGRAELVRAHPPLVPRHQSLVRPHQRETR